MNILFDYVATFKNIEKLFDNYMTAKEAKEYGIIDEIFISRNVKA